MSITSKRPIEITKRFGQTSGPEIPVRHIPLDTPWPSDSVKPLDVTAQPASPFLAPPVPAVPVTAAKKKATKPRVDNEAFVRFCLSCKSYSELAGATGMTIASVRMRHAKLRKQNVKLPKYPKQKKATDCEGLNAIIAAKLSEDIATEPAQNLAESETQPITS